MERRPSTARVSADSRCISSMRIRVLLSLSLAIITTSVALAKLDESKKNAPRKCLDSLPEIYPKRYFYVDDQALSIKLGTSHRIPHQIATYIVKILLEEMSGYDGVDILVEEDYFNATTAIRRVAAYDKCQEECIAELDLNPTAPQPIPDSMVNLEVWLPPGDSVEDLASPDFLLDVGPLGPSGRLMWLFWSPFEQIDKITGHWKDLRDARSASHFAVTEEDMNMIRAYAWNNKTKRFHCNSDECFDGVFEPEACRTNSNEATEIDNEATPDDCALMIAGNYEVSKFLIQHINTLQLRVKVIWVGSNALLERIVMERIDDNCNVLFFHHTQAQLFFEHGLTFMNFSQVLMPQCVPFMRMSQDTRMPDVKKDCKYELNTFRKVVWAKLERGAPEAFAVITSMSFNQEDYDSLLELYVKAENRSIREAACQWLHGKGLHKWSHAQTPNQTSIHRTTTLYLGGIFPFSGAHHTAVGVVPAARMAVHAVNQNKSILPDHKLELMMLDGQCQPDMVMMSFIEYITFKYFSRMVGILGPACSNTLEPIAEVSKHFKIVVISYSAEGAAFSDQKRFPYFFRTIGENQQFSDVYLQLFKRLGWNRVASLTEDGTKYSEYLSQVQDYLVANNITFVANRKFPRMRSSQNMSQYLDELKAKSVRIIIADFYASAARAVMCGAYQKQMTAQHGYVWFLPKWYPADWYDTDQYNYNATEEEFVACTTSEMTQALEGHLSLTYSYFADDEEVMQENITVREWRRKYHDACDDPRIANNINKFASRKNADQQFLRKRYKANAVQPSEYAGYAYDAVWTYALALDVLLKENHSYQASFHSERTITRLVELISTTDFYGVSGRVRFFGPSRRPKINIYQWTSYGSHLVGSYTPAHEGTNESEIILSEYTGSLALEESKLQWNTTDGRPPPDGSMPPDQCVLEGFSKWLDADCDVAIIVANVLGLLGFGIILLICLITLKRRYDKKVQLAQERMFAMGLSSASMLDLDRWQIPRNTFVMNRKIGEGAFGTVYGGECHFEEKGWVAVAVKSLKEGASHEDKMDFLREANVMRKFDHPNIVKFLGVCTQEKQVYTIMEFLLYGDLKTYLLSRRNLINSPDSDEVSNIRLTSIALGIARALAYLNDNKYVHRDVACRNCLVNANRVAKLGDFGMTRPVYEKDYYRFHRKGLLPVRWMAPESLMDGLFTHMSDVWSYGVLLFEIITFGSFPYQGMSNNQVLEAVKTGHRLTIPAGIPDQLVTLLRSCWDRTPTKRPQASEICEILAKYPRLITPALDVPAASVEIESTDSLEMAGPPAPKDFRRYSEGRPRVGVVHRKAGGIHSDSHSSGGQSSQAGQSSLEFARFAPDSPTSTSGYISFLENVGTTGNGSMANGSAMTVNGMLNGSNRQSSGTWFNKRNSFTASSAAGSGYISARRYVMMPGRDPDLFSKKRFPDFGANL